MPPIYVRERLNYKRQPNFFNPIKKAFILDPYYDNVVLHLNGDGANNSTVITDSSVLNNAVTVNGAKISTAQSKYGGASILFDGSPSTFISIADSAALSMLAKNFTMEWWQYALATTGIILGKGDAATVGGSEFAFLTNGSRFFYMSGGNTYDVPVTIATSQWEHIAIVKNGTSLRSYKNGILASSVTLPVGASINNTAQPFKIGAYATGGFNGYIDCYRLTESIARYTGNFNPETDTFLAY